MQFIFRNIINCMFALQLIIKIGNRVQHSCEAIKLGITYYPRRRGHGFEYRTGHLHPARFHEEIEYVCISEQYCSPMLHLRLLRSARSWGGNILFALRWKSPRESHLFARHPMPMAQWVSRLSLIGFAQGISWLEKPHAKKRIQYIVRITQIPPSTCECKGHPVLFERFFFCQLLTQILKVNSNMLELIRGFFFTFLFYDFTYVLDRYKYRYNIIMTVTNNHRKFLNNC